MISQESKDLIKERIDFLQAQKIQLIADIQNLKDKRDALVLKRDALVLQINKLQGDLSA
jgi:hypothetical protein